MTTTQNYDAIIIGAGQAGGPLSTTLAKAGWKTALIERKHIGGTCVNEGCTPTKTMVASARVAHLARRGAEYGVHTGAVTVDLAKVRERKRNIVNDFRNGSQNHIERTEGVDLFFGEGSFTGAKSIKISMNDGTIRHLTAETIFINTGGRPVNPPITGLDQVPTLDSTSIMELDRVPEHLIVIGGGYIGLEFGQMFQRFGSQVTVLQRGSQLVAREDVDVAEELANILREEGMQIVLNANTEKAEEAVDGSIKVTVSTPEGKQTITGSHLLVAAGRKPNTDMLNLDSAGVKTNRRGFVIANEKLETNIPGIYALGDVKGGAAFTHISYDDFRIIRTNLLEGGNASTKGRMVPYTLFTDPQLGRVGISEKEAAQQGLNYRVAKLPMTHVARALEMDETRGFMKAIVDADSHQILGGAILGIEGGEVASVLQVAMMGKIPYTTIRDGVFSHPTLTESLNNLFMSMDG